MMNNAILSKFLFFLFSLILVSPFVSAQNVYDSNFSFKEDDSRNLVAVKKKYHSELEKGAYVRVYSKLLEEFRSQDGLWTADSVQDEKERFILGLEQFIRDLTVIYSADNPKNDSLKGGRFSVTAPNAFGGQLGLKYYDTNDELRIIVIKDSLGTAEAEDLRYRMNTLQKLTDELSKESRLAVQKKLVSLNRQWDNYHFSGKSQYPWEFLINSLFYSGKRPLISPPKSQLILLHPNLSLEIDFTDIGSLKSYESLNIEVLGFARNIDDFKKSIGASFAVSLNNTLGNGYGGIISINSSQLGILYHPDSKSSALLITLDILKLVQNGKSQWDKLRE